MTRLLLKVGKMTYLQIHPLAQDQIYFPHIDTGEGKVQRTIATGLVKHYKEEDLLNRFCVVMINIRRLSIYGVKTEGIILCAQKYDKVEPLLPPPDSKPGDLITVPGYKLYSEKPTRVTYDEFNMIADDLRVNADRQAIYRGIPLEVEGKGFVTTELLDNCSIRSPIKD